MQLPDSARSKNRTPQVDLGLIILRLLALALLFLPFNAASQENTKRVLILTGSDPNRPGFAILTRSIQSTLRDRSASRVELLYELQQELLDNSQSQTGDEELTSYLKRKYANNRIDLVLVMVASRFRLLAEKDPTLFRDIPKIFYDFDNEREATNRSLGPNVTGIWASLDRHRATLDLALALNPDARKVVVVSGATPQNKMILEQMQADFRAYESRAEFSYLTGETIEEVKRQLAALDKGSIVIFASFSTDKMGNNYIGPEALSMLAPVSGAPVYGSAETLMGQGITGGRLLDFEATGKRIGEMGLRILAGEKPERIQQETAPCVTTVDWRELQRWGLNEERLPPGSVVRFKQPSFWELYKWYAVGLLAVMMLEALLIAWLLFLRARRRQAEAENLRLARLAEAEHKRLDEIVSNVPGIVWEAVIDPVTKQRKTTFISSYLQKMLGYTPEEWLAASPGFGLVIMDQEDRERVSRDTEAVVASGKEGISEFRWLGKDGQTVWTESHLSAISDGNGVIGLRGVTLDITQRKLAEATLRQSEERFSKAFRSNPQPMSLTTLAEGRYIDVNESFLAMSGYTRDEVIGQTSLALGIWDNPEGRADVVQQVREGGSVVNAEMTFRTRNGSERLLLVSAEKFELGGEECLLAAANDITERMVAQQALQESEVRFRNMADTAPVMIWVSGADKACTYVNQRWLDFTGHSMEQELGSGWAEGVHPDDRARSLETYVRAFDRREQFSMEYQLRRADRCFRWVIDSATPRFSQAGEFLGYIGSCMDITDRKESEESLRLAHEEVSRLKNQLQEENIYLQEEIKLGQNFGEIIGASEALKYVLFKIEQVAPTDSTVLISGETGTGKELVARAIHSASPRRDRPLVRVNCGALSASLIESELFGHEKGAFTGASARKIGRFELADGATIFLDEIGELPTELQVKLLRLIQEGEFERLGSSKTIKADARIIAATNRHLAADVKKGLFREDLWFRLNVFPITVPPLRDRREDIPLLVEHFASMFAHKFGKLISSVSPTTLRSLSNYSWPGNVRELANVIERAVINAQGSVLRIGEDFETTSVEPLSSSTKTLEEIEREYIIRILNEASWRIEGRHGAARTLGMNPSTLRARINKLEIHKQDLQ